MQAEIKHSLKKRVQGAAASRGRLPKALGLRDEDFFDVVGEMTHQEECQQALYEKYVKPYAPPVEEGQLRRVYDLVANTDDMPEKVRQDYLYNVLVQPFTDIKRCIKEETT